VEWETINSGRCVIMLGLVCIPKLSSNHLIYANQSHVLFPSRLFRYCSTRRATVLAADVEVVARSSSGWLSAPAQAAPSGTPSPAAIQTAASPLESQSQSQPLPY
jgi:hypothetical protein